MEKKKKNSTEHNRSVPKLRFPEFKGQWDKKKLGEVAEFKVTNSFSRENLNYENGFVKNIHYGDIHTKFQTLFDITKEEVPYINAEISISRISDDFYCKEGDLVFADASEDLNDVGKSIEIVNLNNEKLLSGLHTLLARPKENYFSIGFNGYLLKSNNIRLQIKKEAQGSKVLSINVGRISKIELHFPTLPEQKHIASFFTILDKKIAELKQKKNLLEQYKKGVMQKMFSQELRFNDEKGKAFPKWEKKKLGDVLIKNSNKNKGQRYSLVQSVSNKHGFINQDEMFEDRRVASKDTSNYYVIEKGHFAYNPSRIDVGSLAYKFDDEVSTISPLYISFRAKKEYLKDDYLLNWFNTEQFIKQMNSSFEGSVRNTLSYESLVKMEVSIPSITEQTKIANFLSAIDEKINRTENQIQQTQQYKKGLLQKMFI